MVPRTGSGARRRSPVRAAGGDCRTPGGPGGGDPVGLHPPGDGLRLRPGLLNDRHRAQLLPAGFGDPGSQLRPRQPAPLQSGAFHADDASPGVSVSWNRDTLESRVESTLACRITPPHRKWLRTGHLQQPWSQAFGRFSSCRWWFPDWHVGTLVRRLAGRCDVASLVSAYGR